MGSGLLLVALLDGVVRFAVPGFAILGSAFALAAWGVPRPWAGVRAAAPWLLAPWAMLVLFDLVGGFGLAAAFKEIASMKPAILAPVVAGLIVVVDLIRWEGRI
jgi:hypothetical protein